MAYGIKHRKAVKNNYVNRMLSMAQSAKLAGVPVNTARRWKDEAFDKGEDWEKLRAAAAMSNGKSDDFIQTMVNEFVVMQQNIMESLKTADMTAREKVEAMASLADAFSKTIKSAGLASPAISKLAVANDIIQLLGDFIQKHYPQHVNAFIEVLEPFGEEISANYGR